MNFLNVRAKIIKLLFVELGSCYVSQAGLKLLTSGDPPASDRARRPAHAVFVQLAVHPSGGPAGRRA